MNQKIIIFDMDGVLFDSMGIAQEFFIKKHPGVTPVMYKEMYAGNYHEESEKYSHLKLSEADEKKLEDQTTYAEAKSKAPLFDGIKDLLVSLKNNGFILTLNTSAFVKTTVPLLEKADIKYLFDLIVTAEISKSKVEKFNLISEKFGIDKNNIIFVTDSLGDVKEADVAKIPTIAVTWGIHDRSYFNPEINNNLIAIIDSVDELKGKLVYN